MGFSRRGVLKLFGIGATAGAVASLPLPASSKTIKPVIPPLRYSASAVTRGVNGLIPAHIDGLSPDAGGITYVDTEYEGGDSGLDEYDWDSDD